MKDHTSKLLKAVALFCMSFPISYLISTAIMFDVPFGMLLRLYLSPFFYLLCATAVAVGYALWEMKPWCWIGLKLTVAGVFYQNAVLAVEFAQTHHRFMGFLMTSVALLGLTYRIGREVRVAYFLPRIRWWEVNTGLRMAIPAKGIIETSENTGQKSFQGEIVDLSLKGCFVKTADHYPLNAEAQLEFNVFGQRITCRGTIVHQAASGVTHPRGIGIKFIYGGRSERRKMRIAALRFRRISSVSGRSEDLNAQSDLLHILERLQNGEGRIVTRD